MKLYYIMTREESERFIDGYYNKFWRATHIFDIWRDLEEGETFKITSEINFMKMEDNRFSLMEIIST